MVQRNSPVPLYLQIGDELRRRIRDGELSPNEQVPSEMELAEQFAVSRMTARKGVDALVAEGLLFRHPGKGTFVAGQRIPHQFSTAISFSAAMDHLGRRHETRVLAAELAPAPEEIAAHLGVPTGEQVVHIQRVRDVDAVPAAIHSAWLPRRYSILLEADLKGSLTQQMQLAGAVIVHTRDLVEGGAATSEQAERLGVDDGAPIIRIVGLGYAANQNPLRVVEAIYRADRFRFILDSQAKSSIQVELLARQPIA